jgi:hypothetical protein
MIIALLSLVCNLSGRPAHGADPASFELDLKELKPAVKPAPQKPAPQPAKPAAKKQPAKAVEKTAVQKAAVVKAKPVKTIEAKPAVPQTASKPATEPLYREIILSAAPPCELAPNIIAAIASPVSTTEILHNMTIAAPYAATYEGANLVVTCGISAAEELTYRRLLAAHGAELLNIIGNEQPEQLMQEICAALGASYQIMTEKRKDNGVVYLFAPRSPNKQEFRVVLIPTKKAP